MIDYQLGYILIVSQNKILYVDVQEQGVETIDSSKEIIELAVKEDSLDCINLNQNFKIFALQEIGNANGAFLSSLVLEDIQTREIRFVKLDRPEKSNQEGKRYCIKFVQLGIQVANSQMKPSPIIKYSYVCKMNPQTKKRH